MNLEAWDILYYPENTGQQNTWNLSCKRENTPERPQDTAYLKNGYYNFTDTTITQTEWRVLHSY